MKKYNFPLSIHCPKHVDFAARLEPVTGALDVREVATPADDSWTTTVGCTPHHALIASWC